jgi:hypothetical protein
VISVCSAFCSTSFLSAIGSIPYIGVIEVTAFLLFYASLIFLG